MPKTTDNEIDNSSLELGNVLTGEHETRHVLRGDFVLGSASYYTFLKGWLFIPNVSGRIAGRVCRDTYEESIPRWARKMRTETLTNTELRVRDSITDNEIDVLNGIAYHENCASNTATPERVEDVCTWCIADDFSDTLTTNQVKGVLSSLVKKELVWIEDYGVNEGGVKETVVNFTEVGFGVWAANDRKQGVTCKRLLAAEIAEGGEHD